jgi:hypothetical protein
VENAVATKVKSWLWADVKPWIGPPTPGGPERTPGSTAVAEAVDCA